MHFTVALKHFNKSKKLVLMNKQSPIKLNKILWKMYIKKFKVVLVKKVVQVKERKLKSMKRKRNKVNSIVYIWKY